MLYFNPLVFLMCVFYTSECEVPQENTLRDIPLQSCLFALKKQSDTLNREIRKPKVVWFYVKSSHADVTHSSAFV